MYVITTRQSLSSQAGVLSVLLQCTARILTSKRGGGGDADDDDDDDDDGRGG